jgi:DNA-binding FadR family transcriptional regulator
VVSAVGVPRRGRRPDRFESGSRHSRKVLRMLFEVRLVGLAAQRATEEDVVRLHALLAEAEAAADA